MGDVQHEVLSVLLESLYTRELLSKTTYESANQLVQSTIDFPRFFGYPVCCKKEGEEDGCTQSSAGDAPGQVLL